MKSQFNYGPFFQVLGLCRKKPQIWKLWQASKMNKNCKDKNLTAEMLKRINNFKQTKKIGVSCTFSEYALMNW